MKIAIVGTSHALTENEERDIQQLIANILNDYDRDSDEIISGGAKGVDIMAIELASSRGFIFHTILPESEKWEGGYKERNLKIAKMCDALYCISIPERSKKERCYHHTPPAKHQKTAGCWTMKEALKLNKECMLLITTDRSK